MGIMKKMAKAGVNLGHKLADVVAPGTTVDRAFEKAYDLKVNLNGVREEAWSNYKEEMREITLNFVGRAVLGLDHPLRPEYGDHGRVVVMKLGELLLAFNDRMDELFPFINRWDKEMVGQELWEHCNYRIRRECEVMHRTGEVRLAYWHNALASGVVCQTSRIKWLARRVQAGEAVMGMNAMYGPFSGPLFTLIKDRSSVRFVDTRVDLSSSMMLLTQLHEWTERPTERELFIKKAMLGLQWPSVKK